MTTKIYLSDVIDHLDSVVTSIDQFVSTCDHLTDFIFNVGFSYPLRIRV